MTDETEQAPETCHHPEHARLQAAMIGLLNEQVRELRERVRQQTEEILDLRRVVRVRDDLLYLRSQEVERLRGARPGGVRAWVSRILRGGSAGASST